MNNYVWEVTPALFGVGVLLYSKPLRYDRMLGSVFVRYDLYDGPCIIHAR